MRRPTPDCQFRRAPVPTRLTRFALLVAFACSQVSCVTVRPQDRAALADPTMQFEGDPQQAAALRHALENREGSFGGAGVAGGGCGCN